MSRARIATVAALLLCSIAITASSQPRASASTFTLSIVATTDLHGGVIQRGERGGLALLGGYVRNIRAARARDGGAVLLVDSGDMFQGTLESNLNEGAVVVDAYNGLGYAATAIGNHEFDYGPVGPDATPVKPGEDPRGALKARAAQARFPFLAANIIDDATGKPVAWPNVKPSTIVTAGGVKVGLVGVTTLQTPQTTIAENIRGLTFAPLAPIVVAEATSLRSRGASVIVVLAHAGGTCTRFDNPEDVSSCAPMAEVMNLARALPPGLVDVIAAGHTHQAIAHDVAGIAVVEAFAAGRALSRVDLTIERASGKVAARHIFPPRDLCAREDPATHACDAAVPQAALVPARYEDRLVTPDKAAAATIAPAVRRALMVKNQPLGVFLETPIRVAAQTESALSDLVADGMLAATAGADVAVGNGGALRTDLAAGPLTYGQVYEVYPFDNRPVTLTLTGDQLARVVTYNLQRREPPTEILSIAGFRVNATCEAGTLRVALARTSGAPIRPDEKLTIVTPDFVALGGEGLLAPAGPLGDFTLAPGAPVLHDMLGDWLRRRGGRLNESQFTAPENRRWSYPGQRPVSCS